MNAQQPYFELLSVIANEGEGNYLARVSFAFKPSQLTPIQITHDVQKNGSWKTYTEAEIHGAGSVQIKSSFLRKSNKGDLFIQVPHVGIPWELSRAVAEAAYQRLETGEGGAA